LLSRPGVTLVQVDGDDTVGDLGAHHQQAVRPGGRGDGVADVDRGQQGASARVGGVLAQQLDASGHEPGHAARCGPGRGAPALAARPGPFIEAAPHRRPAPPTSASCPAATSPPEDMPSTPTAAGTTVKRSCSATRSRTASMISGSPRTAAWTRAQASKIAGG